jgi:uncharacterized phiE125 gp8 family phage protein
MLRIVEKPASDPVSLEEAKAQLRISASDTSNDVVIQGLIPTATRLVQALVQRVFVSQTMEWVLPGWRSELCIPIAPVSKDGIKSINYVDWATQTQMTLDPSLYVVQTVGDGIIKVFPKFATIWPIVFSFSPEPVVINFVAGYKDQADLPPNVKTAILLQIRHLYSLGEFNAALRKETEFGLGETQYQLTPETAGLIPGAVNALMLSEVW